MTRDASGQVMDVDGKTLLATSRWATAYYCLRETVANIRHHALATMLTILVIALGALIFESFGLVSANISRVVQEGSDGLFLELYFTPSASEEAQWAQRLDLLQRKEVLDVRWITAEAALAEFEGQGYGQLLTGIEGNPLPASLFVRLEPTLTQEEVKALGRKLGERPEFEDWRHSGELAEQLRPVVRLTRWLVTMVGFFLALLLSAMVGGTVKLAFDARRTEMEILELVGATAVFIRLPYLLEGGLLGAMGGLLSLSALYGIYLSVVSSVDFGSLLFVGFDGIRFFGPGMLLAFCVGTTVLGFVGSFLALSGDWGES